MGEVMPILVAGLIVLVVLVAVMAKTQLNRNAVVKPMDQEDMVERVKIRLTAEDIKTLSKKLALAADNNNVVELYDATGRLFRFEVVKS